MPFPFKYFLSFKHREAEKLAFLLKELVVIIAKLCHQVVICLATVC